MPQTTPEAHLDLFDLSGKVALVTGAAQGLGAAMAQALSERGAHLALVDVQEDVRNVAAEIVKAGGGAPLVLHADIRHRDEVERCVDEVLRWRGRIDVLVNNAGIHRRVFPDNFRQQDVDDVIAVNLLGSFYVAAAVGKMMAEQRGGSIINVSALGGGVTGLGRGGTIYAVTKGGLVSLTRELAAEWGRFGVRVNAIAPGWIRTPMTSALQNDAQRSAKVLQRIPLGRWGEARDVVGAVVFLASEASAYITGQVIPIDGGASSVICLGDE